MCVTDIILVSDASAAVAANGPHVHSVCRNYPMTVSISYDDRITRKRRSAFTTTM